MPDTTQPTTLYKPSIARKIIALLFAILVLIIGILFAVVSFHQASQGYKIVYSNTPPTTESEPAYGDAGGLYESLYGNGQKAYKVPFTSSEIQNFYLKGFGSIVAVIVLCFLAYKYSKLSEIKINQRLNQNQNMNTTIPSTPINPLNQTSVTTTPPKKSKKPFLIVLLVIIVGIVGYIVYSIMVARAISRDAKRRADIMQLQAGLELYRNDHNDYPNSLSELTQPYKGQPYIGVIPVAPKPADGPCTETQNTYSYKKISSKDYELTYCIGRGGQFKNFITGKITTINPGVQIIRKSSPF